jgi:hypothetical protein
MRHKVDTMTLRTGHIVQGVDDFLCVENGREQRDRVAILNSYKRMILIKYAVLEFWGIQHVSSMVDNIDEYGQCYYVRPIVEIILRPVDHTVGLCG